MIPSIKAEFRKLLTVRSTYIVVALVILLVAFFAGYIEGWKAGATVNAPTKLAGEMTGALGAVSIFGAIVAILLMSHEYRYNTIMYTLTASNSRSKTLFAKIFTVSVFALLFTVFVSVFSPLMTYIGAHLHGLDLNFAAQSIPYSSIVWRSLFFGWSYGMVGLLLVVLIRSQVGAIASLFLIPGAVEQLLTLLLKKNAVYLPFTSLSAVLDKNQISFGRAALVFAAYLAVGWLVAWILFLRRDAN